MTGEGRVSSPSPPALPPRFHLPWIVLIVAAGISAWVLPWNLDHLGTSAGWEASWKRFGSFLRAFSTPDLSPDTLRLAARLAAETLAIAILGVGLGLVLAYPMAVAASSAVLGGGAPARGPSRALGYVVREGARLALDILRGIPDFAWALVLLTIFGPTAVTATLAIAVHVAGILGKIFSELWDSVPEGQVEVLRATGAGRLRVLLYGIQPMAGSGMLSFLLMRFECAVRNASVIGAVSGGGLGASIMQELGYDNKGRAVTFLVAALMLTVSADLLSNLLRGLVRRERSSSLRGAQRRRRLAGAAVVAAIGLSFFWVRQPIADLPAELGRMDLGYLRRHFGQLLRPDFSAGTLLEALQGMLVPLGLGVLATLFAYVAAACFAWLGSATFQIRSHAFMPERSSRVRRVWRLGLVLGARTLTAVLRGVPEVAWVWILALFFLTGIEAALGALLIHSAGVLARVFTETVDNIPYRRLEAVGAPGRASAFTHGALPMSRADWRSYALFQFESNVRTGVVLGIVGVGGLGHLFRRALAHRAMDRCATFLIALVLLTLVIDRLSRRIQSGPRC